jgi:hypothetical protein
MRVLVACEFSGIVRDAFRDEGHDAWCCDTRIIQPRNNSPYGTFYNYECDVMEVLNLDWDLMIAHPPCTAIAVSGNGTYAGTQARMDGIKFVEQLWDAPVDKICIENPVGVLSTMSKLGKPAQYIQPWQFGHGETKKTGLWLKNLPKLKPTNVVSGREQRVWKMGPSKDRSDIRSLTYTGIAKAMAEQWGNL